MVKLAAGLLKHLVRAFGSLHDSVLTASDLMMKTKGMVYQSVVLRVLLYGAGSGWKAGPIPLMLWSLHSGYQ